MVKISKRLRKSYKSSRKRKHSNVTDSDKKKRNFKFMQRSKIAEERMRKQKVMEDRYQLHNNLADVTSSEENEDKEEHPYDKLLLSFGNLKNDVKQKIIESSSEDEQADKSKIKLMRNRKEYESDANDVKTSKRNKRQENDIIKEKQEFDEQTETIESSELTTSFDPFAIYLEKELSPEQILNLTSKPIKLHKSETLWPELGTLLVEIPSVESLPPSRREIYSLFDKEEFATEGTNPKLKLLNASSLKEFYIKSQLVNNIIDANKSNLRDGNAEMLTSLQNELFCIMNNYQDLFYPQRTLQNGEEIRFIYCLHALNHMLKTRTKILYHNAKILMKSGKKSTEVVPDSYRDQGLVRPKVLILVPFRESAYRVINNLISILFGVNKNGEINTRNVINYKRFAEEFTGNTIRFPRQNPKPGDYEKTFSGNTDDTFRIGIALTKKSIKLYTDFYSSDILISSPLGLRMIIGAPGDEERDYDYLSSLELLVLDQAELFFAQNWDHLLHVIEHLHLQPQSVRYTDFSRVRSWCLNGLSKFYRQTLLFSSHELAEFRSLFNNHCVNFRGKVKIVRPILNGHIRKIIVRIPQVLQRFDTNSVQSSFDDRFNFFINEILPPYKKFSMAHCMIYIPSYFDYVRIRNYFKAESINFVQICEYTEDGKMSRARDMFYHSSAQYLLYSERAHFFRRTRIKGIRHLVMYQPPFWPHFYPEMINLMQDSNQNSRDGLESSMSIKVIFSKYDILQLAEIFGTEKAANICHSHKASHMFITGN